MALVGQDLRLQSQLKRRSVSLLEIVPCWRWAQVGLGATGQGIENIGPMSMSSLDLPHSLHDTGSQTLLCIRMLLRWRN